MTRTEVRNFLTRIQSHYPEFIVDDFKLSEWYSELKKYDAEDINIKLEKHIGNEEYGRFAPKLFNLTKFLKTNEERQQNITWLLKCEKCGRIFKNTDYTSHYDICVLIATMVRDLKKYFNQDISREKLEELSQAKLYELYNKYVDKMLSSEFVSTDRKEILKKCYIKEVLE